jgi:uncharacterized protein (TIGR02246 family)
MIMTKTGYEDEIEKIRQIREEVEEAEKNLDAVALGKLFADDVAMMPEGGPEVRGSEAVIAYHRDLYDGLEVLDIDFLIEDIAVLSSIAMEKGSYTANLVPKGDGETQNISGQYLYFYEQDSDSKWKILRMSW